MKTKSFGHLKIFNGTYDDADILLEVFDPRENCFPCGDWSITLFSDLAVQHAKWFIEDPEYFGRLLSDGCRLKLVLIKQSNVKAHKRNGSAVKAIKED